MNELNETTTNKNDIFLKNIILEKQEIKRCCEIISNRDNVINEADERGTTPLQFFHFVKKRYFDIWSK